MTKNSREITQAALTRLGVASPNDAASADDYAFSLDVLQAVFDEIKAAHAPAISWTVETVPDNVAQALVDVLLQPLAAAYERPVPVPQSRALTRLRTILLPDDRADDRDLDEDGTVSAAEIAAQQRAAFY